MKSIPVAAALIIQSGKFLVAQRARGELIGAWEFAGGKIEDGETKFEAIEREIKEELGIDIEATTVISNFKHEYPFAQIDLTLIECHLKDSKQKIILDGSHSNFQWIDESDRTLQLAPLDQKIMEYLRCAK